jgi:hypothetical protein
MKELGGVQAWRVYQRGLEKWLADLLQPVFDNLVAEGGVPSFVQRLRILEFSLVTPAPSPASPGLGLSIRVCWCGVCWEVCGCGCGCMRMRVRK